MTSDHPPVAFRGTVPAFNFNDQHDLRAIVAAAEAAGRAAILMVSVRASQYTDLELLFDMFSFYRRRAATPLWVELDHCSDMALLGRAAELGFDVLMADFSHLPLHDNLRQVRRVVSEFGSSRCLIEAEASPIPAEPSAAMAHPLTTPAELRAFQAETGCDLVAPHLGTAHGFDLDKPFLDPNRIRSLVQSVSVPVVAHGCDFLSAAQLGVLVGCGVAKVNFGPQLRSAWAAAARRAWRRASARAPINGRSTGAPKWP